GGREPPAGRPPPVHGCPLRPQHRHDRNRVVEASMRFPARPATIPPQLPEWDPAWSRIVEAQSSDGTHAFHVLDTLPTLRAAGLEPEGTIVALHGHPTSSHPSSSRWASPNDSPTRRCRPRSPPRCAGSAIASLISTPSSGLSSPRRPEVPTRP